MRLKSLFLKDFRLFKEERLDFSEGLNHFIGNNAQGKTTLIEALFLLSSGKSFRTHHLKDLVREGAERFRLLCYFERYGIEQKIELVSDGLNHQLIINASPSHKLSSLLGLIQGVVISPEDNPLVKASPDERRRFLDQHLCCLDPLYVHHLHRYRKALKQRNALLKQRALKTLHVWEVELAKSAGYLIHKRQKTSHKLNIRAKELLLEISDGKDNLKLSYKTSFSISSQKASIKNESDSSCDSLDDIQAALLKNLEKGRNKDLMMQATSVGPHRDDLVIELGGKNAKAFASEGQKRSILYALRLAQWQLTSEENNEPPFIAIDDIGSCLDNHRLKRLIDNMLKCGQVFISSPKEHAFEEAEGFLLHAGKIQAALKSEPAQDLTYTSV